MIGRLVWENISNRPVRTLLSVLMIAVPVTLILTLVGLTHGFIEDSRKRQAGVGADILVKPPGANIISFSTANMPESLVNKLSQEPHVFQAMGEVVAPTAGFDALLGIDPQAFDRMSGGFEFVSGRGFSRPDDILVDTWYAAQRHAHVGSTINLLGHDWKVCGIVQPGKLGHMFAQTTALWDVEGGTGRVSQVYLKLDNPAHTDEVVAALKKKYEGFPIISMRELLSTISVDNIPLLNAFLLIVMGIGVATGFLVVFQSMYMAVLQRTREIGILKSMGAKRSFIVGLILAEAACLGFGGTILGILFTFGTKAAIHAAMPASLPQAIVYYWWPIAGAIAMGAALLGAFYPGMLAARQDPIEALAYE